MKQRATGAIVLLVGFLTACQPEDKQRSADPKTVLACMDAQHSHDDYLLVTTCEPLGPQRTFQGTWFVGFELSAFRKGYFGVPAELGTSPAGLDEIVAPTSLSNEVYGRNPEGASAYQVTFRGQESMLPRMAGSKLVVIDKIMTLRPVAISSNISRPSK